MHEQEMKWMNKIGLYDRPAMRSCVEMRNYSEIISLEEENVNWQSSNKKTILLNYINKT